MGDYDFGGVFVVMVNTLIFLSLLGIFGVWKLVEIVVWIFQHVAITWN